MLLDKDKILMYTIFTLFWVWCTFGFISEEIAPFMLNLKSGLFFIVDVAMLFLGLVALKNKWDKIYIFSFLILTYWITCVYNGYDFIFYFNGLREFVYLLWIVPILRYIYGSQIGNEFVRKFDKHLFAFLVVQAVCVTYQFVKYGANDHGGGSMGNGFSGVVSILIYLSSFYLVKKRMDPENYISSLIKNKWLIILLFPTFLNETKISFILLMLYFVLLLPITKKSIIKLAFMTPILCVMLYLVFHLYMSATGSQWDITDKDFLEEYFYAAKDDDIVEWMVWLQENGEEFAIDGSNDLPRFTKYIMIPELNDYYPGHDITGYGIGHFKGGTMIKSSKFYLDNEWLLKGSIPYGYHAYIQIGLFAILFFVWLWFRLASLKSGEKKEYGIIIYIAAISVMIMLYNDFFRFGPLCILFLYIYSQAFRWEACLETNRKTS